MKMRQRNLERRNGRPPGGKNIMRTPEEKEVLIKAWYASGMGYKAFATSKGIRDTLFVRWLKKYESCGLEGLVNQTGKHGSGNRVAALHTSKNLSEVDRLKLELIKKEIEIERLKKGYMVRGVGRDKEYYIPKKKSSR